MISLVNKIQRCDALFYYNICVEPIPLDHSRSFTTGADIDAHRKLVQSRVSVRY
jgi:hypothetical protein